MVAEDKVLSAALVQCNEDLVGTRAEYDVRDAQVIAERAQLAVEERRLTELQQVIFELENRVRLSESKIEFQIAAPVLWIEDIGKPDAKDRKPNIKYDIEELCKDGHFLNSVAANQYHLYGSIGFIEMFEDVLLELKQQLVEERAFSA